MKGKYRIVVENKKIKYDFEIKRNLTIIKGDSATGKTTLVDMIGEYYEQGAESGVQLHCEKTCMALLGRNWKATLLQIHDSIVFIDEGNSFISTKEFATIIKNTDNYYVIVSRESLPSLPYSVSEIYGIRNSGKYGTLKQKYNEVYRIYGTSLTTDVYPDIVVTEDSGAGFDFFNAVCLEHELICQTSNGKSNIFKVMEQQGNENRVLIIADGAAFGPEIEKIMALIKNRKNIFLYLPESFEWLILMSEIIEFNEIKEILDAPYDYVESSEFESWEQYFSKLLIDKTRDTVFSYSKKALNEAYLGEKTKKKILNQMVKVHFEK